MTERRFQAILIDKQEDGQSASLTELALADLPDRDVLVRVEASGLNYKDGLLLSGAIPLIHSYPMVPGIDLAGTVIESRDARWSPGDRVIANGWGLGEKHWGGFAEFARLDGDWLVRCPEDFTARQSMMIGTAGYTAMLCLLALERHGVMPGDGDILITGASGGVGSIAISLLAGCGYRVVASTGRPQEAEYLRALGAAEIADRAALSEPGAPLQSERWAGAIDTAGSHTLANICAQLRYGGTVAATGIAQGADFPATMYPLALRGITICGVDSVHAPMALREKAWQRLARDLDRAHLEQLSDEVGLADAIGLAPSILAGGVRGRTVITMPHQGQDA
ncbi:acrylyl-CoA reductase (NADPH) [Sphingopyxis alaskensis]|jgi:acrylyl-CoA reductase (NADPH)|uniref:acrylyl-CoA reductase (NADPH) n=1 Tax=Sphingopyxis alaskensis TaxID=117207 RepID=UPI00203B1CAD|nr:MDR family oxidoreductase [Sphingopyxis alaskensis]MCM3419780.1 oxidoreductase [Sphingopyxis alaskensis]